MRAFSGRKGSKGCFSVDITVQIGFALRFGEFLDGVAEHRTRHRPIARREVGHQRRLVALAGFAEQPADGFVNEVMRVLPEDVRDGEGVLQLPVADERHRADDTDALLPECLAAAGEIIQERPVLVQQPLAQQRIAGQVHEVPVVDVTNCRW